MVEIWLQPKLGQHTPTLRTCPPILSVAIIAAIMLNWHAAGVLKYMKVPKGEPKIEEVFFFGETIREVSTSQTAFSVHVC
jgi:hypothetical protein